MVWFAFWNSLVAVIEWAGDDVRTRKNVETAVQLRASFGRATWCSREPDLVGLCGGSAESALVGLYTEEQKLEDER